jgi:hypothetical protein
MIIYIYIYTHTRFFVCFQFSLSVSRVWRVHLSWLGLDFSFFLIDFAKSYLFWIRGCLRVWWRLLFKVFFAQKCIKIIFFYLKKIIFDITTLKWFKNTKKILIWRKKLIFFKNIFKTQKQIGSIENHLGCF